MRFIKVLVVCTALMVTLCGTSPARVMPRACPGSTVVSENGQVCCISGMVTLNGVPLEGATVTVQQSGNTTLWNQSITDITGYASGDNFPSYGAFLSDFPLLAEPGTQLTITASYGRYERTVQIIVDKYQWLDIELAGAWSGTGTAFAAHLR